MNKIYFNLSLQAKKLYRHCRQGSYKTRERYTEAFNRFLKFLATSFRLQKIANIRAKHFTSYVAYLQEKGSSPATIKTELSGIRFWHDQIPGCRYTLPDNKNLQLEKRSIGQKDRTWSDYEFAYLTSQATMLGRDDFCAAVYLARHMGLRIHEIFRIDTAIARNAVATNNLTIKGKGGKIRTIPLHPSIAILFRNLLATTPAGHKLFVPEQMPTHKAIEKLQKFIRDTQKNIPHRDANRAVTFHGLRHTWASEEYKQMTDKGYSQDTAKKQISRLLGHERPDVTNTYLPAVYKKKKGAYNIEK